MSKKEFKFEVRNSVRRIQKHKTILHMLKRKDDKIGHNKVTCH